MIKELWLNFSAKNLDKTKEFFIKIGFTPNEEHSQEGLICLETGQKKTTVLFWSEEVFEQITQTKLSDSQRGSVLVSFDAESREEIDETARKVFDAGGTIFSEPSEIQGWMYGFAFTDLDGHRWNQVYMDFSKMPQA